MGIPQPDNEHLKAGREAHAIIQAHVSGKHQDARLSHIKYTFPVVEEKDFDERCGFEFPMDKYMIRGFYDGLDIKNGRILEIKSSSTMWSMKDYIKSNQRKIYALSNKKFTEGVLVTCLKNPDEWEIAKPKVYPCPMTDKDREDAKVWILDGIEKLESGDLMSDLVNGKCVDRFCYWGENCQFK